MATKLTQEEMQMLGFAPANENESNNKSFAPAPKKEIEVNTDGIVVREKKYDAELAANVGKFAKYKNWYGMIDNTHVIKEYKHYGFVEGSKDGWGSHLAYPDKIEILSDEAEIAKAKESAQWFFKNEIESLTRKIQLGIGDRGFMLYLLAERKAWLAKMA
jgi:hypothetical protein